MGIPGESLQKAPVMETSIQKQPSSRGISSTLYDPRKVSDRNINWDSVSNLIVNLSKRDKNTPFVTCVPPPPRYGMFHIGSPLSFHLNPVGFTTNIITNITKQNTPELTLHEFVSLPLNFIKNDEALEPRD